MWSEFRNIVFKQSWAQGRYLEGDEDDEHGTRHSRCISLCYIVP